MALLLMTQSFLPTFDKHYLLTESFDVDITTYASHDQINYKDGIVEVTEIDQNDPLYLIFFGDETEFHENRGPFWGPHGKRMYDQEPIYSNISLETHSSGALKKTVLYLVEEKMLVFLYSSASGW